MGFATKTPSTPTTKVIPVVSETTDTDTEASTESQTRRKGLLSTILTKNRQTSADEDGNTTLG